MGNNNVEKVTQNVTSRSFVPFTGGLLMLVYAFFWPVEYGAWLGSIVKAFRISAGF